MSYLEPINTFPYLWKDTYDFNFSSWKDRADEYIEQADSMTKANKYDTLEKDGGVTTVVMSNYYPPHDWDVCHDFRDNWLYQRMDELWERWRLMPIGKHISQSWINKHPPRGRTMEHHHQNVQVAVACYLNVPEHSGNLMIQNPLQIYKMGEPLNYNYYDEGMDWMEIPVKTNDVLFFPGWLKHKTGVNRSLEDRYVMSLNIMGRMEFAP